MPKFLSRSKHEEFESNSTLQISDQKERRAKKMQGNWSYNLAGCKTIATCEFSQVAKLQPADTIHPTHCSFSSLFSCISRLSFFVTFFVSSYFNPCKSF